MTSHMALPAVDVAGSQARGLRRRSARRHPKAECWSRRGRNEEAVDGGGPLVAAAREFQLFDDERVEEAGEVGAGRHADAGKRLFDGAGAANAGAAFDDQNTLAGAREVGCAGQSVVAGADHDRVP